MKILLTNDDGLDAPGISALHTAIQSLGEVMVVAPASGIILARGAEPGQNADVGTPVVTLVTQKAVELLGPLGPRVRPDRCAAGDRHRDRCRERQDVDDDDGECT